MAEAAGAYSHLFDAQASSYADFRPTYPDALYQRIYKFADFSERPQVALDIATGSGQCAHSLAPVFSKVIAIDSNVQQLKEAKTAHNIEYRKALAENTQVADSSIDLVTVAQAMHWFDLEAFYTEARRVLKPTGALAVWGYVLPVFPVDTANEVFVHLYNVELGPYWSPKRKLIDQEYAGLEPEPRHFGVVERTKVHSDSTVTLAHFMGYLRTWSAHATYLQRHPDRPDPLIAFKPKLAAALGATDDSYTFTITWPLFVMLAKEPKK